MSNDTTLQRGILEDLTLEGKNCFAKWPVQNDLENLAPHRNYSNLSCFHSLKGGDVASIPHEDVVSLQILISMCFQYTLQCYCDKGMAFLSMRNYDTPSLTDA